MDRSSSCLRLRLALRRTNVLFRDSWHNIPPQSQAAARLAFILSLAPTGLTLIGIQTSFWLGLIVGILVAALLAHIVWLLLRPLHISIRFISILVILAVLVLLVRAPLHDQYLREHPEIQSAAVPKPYARAPMNLPPSPKEDYSKSPKATTPTEDSEIKAREPLPQTATKSPAQETLPRMSPQNSPQVLVQPGGAASFNQQGGITVGQIINNPAQEILLGCVQVRGPRAEEPIAYISGLQMNPNRKEPDSIRVVIRLSSMSRFNGSVDPLPLIEALSSIPGVAVIDDSSRNCGYVLRYRSTLYGMGTLGMEEIGASWFFDERLRGRLESLNPVLEQFKLKPLKLIDPIRTDGVQGAQRRLFLDAAKIDAEIFL